MQYNDFSHFNTNLTLFITEYVFYKLCMYHFMMKCYFQLNRNEMYATV